MRYFFHIAYNGFNYQGWQKLPQANSVQQAIETHLSKVLKTDVTINGCGRTDSQVHASQYFFHADIDKEWNADLTFIVNRNLPDDIALFDVVPMDPKQHARLDAIERTYNYFIHTYEDPFLGTMSSFYPERDLNLEEMKRAVKLLPKYNDYRSFCRKLADQRTTISHVKDANLYVGPGGDNIMFEITSSRFLNGMIRMIVQRLLMIGRGELTVDEFENILLSKEPVDLFRIAYPHGLYLSKVKYPFLELPSRSTIFNSMVSRFK